MARFCLNGRKCLNVLIIICVSMQPRTIATVLLIAIATEGIIGTAGLLTQRALAASVQTHAVCNLEICFITKSTHSSVESIEKDASLNAKLHFKSPK